MDDGSSFRIYYRKRDNKVTICPSSDSISLTIEESLIFIDRLKEAINGVLPPIQES